jgi:hypothetical protein
MVHQLFINGTLFNTFTRVEDALAAFREWTGRGFYVRVAFNKTLCTVNTQSQSSGQR